MSITHDNLIGIARKWLSQRYPIVITELQGQRESPDAIGMNGGSSTLIECKVSQADYVRDQSKFFRRLEGSGMGMYRYYMAPKGVIDVRTLPKKWGLIEVNGNGRTRVVKRSQTFYDWNGRSERGMLVSIIRRLDGSRVQGVSVKYYTIQTDCTATVSVLPVDQDVFKDLAT